MICTIGRAYSEVTPAVLPSSLGSNHSFTLVFSTWPPVSVLRYGLAYIYVEVFLGSVLPSVCGIEMTHPVVAWSSCIRIFLKYTPHDNEANPITLRRYNPPSLHHTYAKLWNINHMSIGFGFRHPLRPD